MLAIRKAEAKSPVEDPKGPNRQIQIQQAIFNLSIDASPDQSAWDHAARWQTEGAEALPGIVDYLTLFGYDALNEDQWFLDSSSQDRPRLHVRIKDHIEKDGHATSFEYSSSHTWYLLECYFSPAQKASQEQVQWQAPRRLAQLRVGLHDPLKAIMGASYGSCFASTPFARRGGLPGTTSRLQEWFSTLTDFLNGNKASPTVVALTLNFLKAHLAIQKQNRERTSCSATLDTIAWDQASLPEDIGEDA